MAFPDEQTVEVEGMPTRPSGEIQRRGSVPDQLARLLGDPGCYRNRLLLKGGPEVGYADASFRSFIDSMTADQREHRFRIQPNGRSDAEASLSTSDRWIGIIMHPAYRTRAKTPHRSSQ
jgi:hypothetical protein